MVLSDSIWTTAIFSLVSLNFFSRVLFTLPQLIHKHSSICVRMHSYMHSIDNHLYMIVIVNVPKQIYFFRLELSSIIVKTPNIQIQTLSTPLHFFRSHKHKRSRAHAHVPMAKIQNSQMNFLNFHLSVNVPRMVSYVICHIYKMHQ